MSDNDKLIIKTPNGKLIQHTYTRGKNKGKVAFKIEWDKDFGKNRTKNFLSAQQYVDSETLRRNAPYMPKITGTLIRTGTLGTRIGSGEVRYVAPYARRQYYDTAQTRSYDPKRGGKWFERMKIDHKDSILRGAKKIAGAK